MLGFHFLAERSFGQGATYNFVVNSKRVYEQPG